MRLANSKSAIFYIIIGLRRALRLSIVRIYWRSVFSSNSINLRFVRLIIKYYLILFNRVYKIFRGIRTIA